MNRLRAEMSAFFDEVYEGDRKVLVFGEGDPHARLVLIGEAPGEQEALQRRPFVGKAGKNLDEFLEITGFQREELYITNVVKFRPTRVSQAGRTVNRAPTQEEVELFLPWLRRELKLINPTCVVTMGNTALRALRGRDAVIGAAHGRALQTADWALFPIYHPASLIYNRSLRDTYIEDLLALKRFLRGEADRIAPEKDALSDEASARGAGKPAEDVEPDRRTLRGQNGAGKLAEDVEPDRRAARGQNGAGKPASGVKTDKRPTRENGAENA